MKGDITAQANLFRYLVEKPENKDSSNHVSLNKDEIPKKSSNDQISTAQDILKKDSSKKEQAQATQHEKENLPKNQPDPNENHGNFYKKVN